MPVYNVSAISHPEFININSLSPFAAKCQIKVLYIGQNRNKSFITKEVATNMAQTLPGCPIVGYYKEEVGDFRDHGEVAIIAEGKINVKKKTQPYGFIAPDAKIWFQNFEETDEYGNTVIREYLVAEGYLWTQFTGADLAIKDGGRPQSMELDEKSLQGYWSDEFSSNIEFFIINDAKFKALCILGKDVEPCFEGSDVTKPDTYSFDGEDIISGLSDIMKQLQFTLNKLEGGNQKMDENLEIQGKVDEQSAIENQDSIENFVKSKEDEEKENKDNMNSDSKEAPADDKDVQNDSSDDKNKEDEDKKKKIANNSLAQYEDGSEGDSSESSDGEDTNGTEEPANTSQEDAESNTEPSNENNEEEPTSEQIEDEEAISSSNAPLTKLKEEYSLLKQDFSELQARYSTLEESYNKLVEFKNQIEDSKKDDMIKSFYMLDDEDKKDVIENKSKYTLDEIEAKLSVICVRKKVNFDLDSDTKTKDEVPTTFDLNGINTEANSIPAWLKAVEATQNRNK